MKTLLLSRRDLEGLLSMDTVLPAVEAAFAARAAGVGTDFELL